MLSWLCPARLRGDAPRVTRVILYVRTRTRAAGREFEFSSLLPLDARPNMYIARRTRVEQQETRSPECKHCSAKRDVTKITPRVYENCTFAMPEVRVLVEGDL